MSKQEKPKNPQPQQGQDLIKGRTIPTMPPKKDNQSSNPKEK